MSDDLVGTELTQIVSTKNLDELPPLQKRAGPSSPSSLSPLMPIRDNKVEGEEKEDEVKPASDAVGNAEDVQDTKTIRAVAVLEASGASSSQPPGDVVKPTAKGVTQKQGGTHSKKNEDDGLYENVETKDVLKNFGKRRIARARDGKFYYWKEKLFVEEFMLYVLFLILYSVVSMEIVPGGDSYWMKSTAKDQFIDEEFLVSDAPNLKKNFQDIGTAEEFWQWLEGPLLNNLYPESDYNGRPLTETQTRFVAVTNRRVGRPRIRQLRVKRDSCDVVDAFQNVIPECIAKYSGGSLSQEAFGPPSNPSKYAWTPLSGVFTWGDIATYGVDGFVTSLQVNATATRVVISELKADAWIDDMTRAVFVEFTLYNAPTNLFTVARLLVEFPASGGAFPLPMFHTVQIFRYTTTGDFIRATCEGLLFLFIIYYIWEEIYEMREGKWNYLLDPWNLFDLVNLSIFIAQIGLRINLIIRAQQVSFDPNSTEYIDFFGIAWWVQQELNISAVNAFLTWFKVFKYAKVSPRLSQLSRTLAKASVDVCHFLLMFCIVILGYSHAGFLLFASDTRGFRNFGVSLITLFKALMGNFDFEAADDANRVLGPAFYMSFMVLVFLILLNMFLAIINGAYTEVVIEDAGKPALLNFRGFWKEFMLHVRAKLGRKKLTKEAEMLKRAASHADLNQDDMVDELELREALAKQNLGFTESQTAERARHLMRRFDTDHDGQLNRRELSKLQHGIDDAAGEGVEISEERFEERGGIAKIHGRVRHMEKRLDGFGAQMDKMTLLMAGIANRLDSIAAQPAGGGGGGQRAGQPGTDHENSHILSI